MAFIDEDFITASNGPQQQCTLETIKKLNELLREFRSIERKIATDQLYRMMHRTPESLPALPPRPESEITP